MNSSSSELVLQCPSINQIATTVAASMRVYATTVQERLDKMESRVSGVERATSAPNTPQSAVVLSSQDSPQEKNDSTDVDSNPDEAEIAAELGKSKHNIIKIQMNTCSIKYMYVAFISAAKRERAEEKRQKKERRNKRLLEIVDQRLKKKQKVQQDDKEEPIPTENGEKKESPVKQETEINSQSQVGVFIY